MGSPYLNSGESIILTTGRVSVNSVQYDLLLTPRYLILVDNRYAEYQPRMIPLLTIQSVKGGTTAGGEMVISLFFADTSGTGEPGPMVLIFCQQPGEQRKRERDEWLKRLMEVIVSVRQETGNTRITIPDQEIEIRPSMRRPVAPEIPRPYKTIITMRPALVDLIITPDEPETPVIPEEIPAAPEAPLEERAGSEVTTVPHEIAGTSGGSGGETGSPEILPASVPGSEGNAGASSQEAGSMITRSSQIPASGEPPVSRYAIDGSGESIAPHEVPETHDSATSPKKGPGYSGAVTLKETVFEELPLADEEEGGEQRSFTDSLLVKTSPITETGLSDIPSPQIPVFEEPPVNPDSMTGSRDTVSPPGSADSAKFSDGREENAGSPIIPAPENVRKTATELPEDSLSVTQPSAPEPAVVESAPVPGQESGPSEAMATGRGEGTESSHQPAAETTSSDQKLPPPSPSPGYRNKSFIAITAGILIILLISGAVILYSPYSAAPGINQTLVPTPGSEQTLVPNPSLQPVSVTTQQVIQQTGVWVRVVYSRNYSGSIGIPGRVRDISGSSEKMYKLFDGDGVAQVKIHKEDNTGDMLTVELYREGEMIDSRKISSPMGSIEFMINTKTGLPPGITPVSTQTNNQTGSNNSRIVYF